MALAMRRSYGPSGLMMAGGEAALTGTSMRAVSGSVLAVAARREEVRIGYSVAGMASQEVERGLVVVSG